MILDVPRLPLGQEVTLELIASYEKGCQMVDLPEHVQSYVPFLLNAGYVTDLGDTRENYTIKATVCGKAYVQSMPMGGEA